MLVALVFLPFSVAMFFAGWTNANFSDPSDVVFVALIGPLYLWFNYILLVKLIWPPEMEISANGIRVDNRALFAVGTYGWSDIDGPDEGKGASGVPLLEMTVKASGKKIRMPPSHFGATYPEMAEVISSARSGHLIDPQLWRADHPRDKLRQRLKDWGLPLLFGGGVGIALALFNH